MISEIFIEQKIEFKFVLFSIGQTLGDTKLDLSFSMYSLMQICHVSSLQDIAELFRPPFYEYKSATATLEKVWPHYVLPML